MTWDGQPGTKGDPLERVYTPASLADAVVSRCAERWTQPGVIFDLGVGAGAFIEPIREHFPGVPIVAVDADPDAKGLALADEAHRMPLMDFWWGLRPRMYGTVNAAVISNPPFSRAAAWMQAVGATELPFEAWLLPADLPMRSRRTGWPAVFEQWSSVLEVVDGRPWPKSSREVGVYFRDAHQYAGDGIGCAVSLRRIDWGSE